MHVSVRLPWHDRGWDGHVCNHPDRNPYCGGLRSVNAERIRTRDVDAEIKLCGSSVVGMASPPPCTETINVFGQSAIEHTHKPPEFIKGAKPVPEIYEPGSSGTWPFENMWLPNGQFRPPEERKREANIHFNSLSPGNSLAFYYCNFDNPLSADSNRYLLVGAARIKAISPESQRWPGAQEDSVARYGGFVWSRNVLNAGPSERVRLPYQEMLESGVSPEELASTAVFVPGDSATRFKYVSRQLDDDDAAILLEKMIRFLRIHQAGDRLPGNPGAWQRSLEWLDVVLAECWAQRGPFPGLTAVLSFLEFKEPADFVRQELAAVPSSERRDWVFARLEEAEEISSMLRHRFAPAIDRWKSLDPDTQKLLKDRMALFALDHTQLERCIGPKRKTWGVDASHSSIYANPYLLSEEYVGNDVNDKISFSRIDHGLRPRPPHDAAIGLERIARTDGRRLRALIVSKLRDEAAAGNTFVDQVELAETIEDPDDDPADVRNALVDEARWRQHAQVFADKLSVEHVDGVNAVFLKTIRDDEARIRSDSLKLIHDGLISASGINWTGVINETSQGKTIDDAVVQQAAALEVLYRARFSVLTGGAGTGKTTVLRAFVSGLRQNEPNHSFLLLAPTGKASVLLSERVGVEAETIHRFLYRKKWLIPPSFAVRRQGGDRETSAKTVIVDESSMIDVTLLASLFRALNLEYVDRIILVGDSGQLPPIGPGRPFLDLIEYLRKDRKRTTEHLAELTFNCRQAQGSNIAILANHFARVEERPDEDIFQLLLHGGDKGDLAVRTYSDESQLAKTIQDTYSDEIARLCGRQLGGSSSGSRLADLYKEAYRLDDWTKTDLDVLQVVAPYRVVVDQLNDSIRHALWGARGVMNSLNGLAILDRVMQVENKTISAYDFDGKKNVERYVPNGQIGFVSPITRSDYFRFHKTMPIRFAPNFSQYKFDMSASASEENLAFAYSLSVHKSQGSQFRSVIAVIPARESEFLSRELIYTLITRAQDRLVLLLEKDAGTIMSRTWGGHSELLRRNSALFRTSRGWRMADAGKFRTDQLIHEALPDLFVRSRGEAIIARTLANLGIGYYYERPLAAKKGGVSKSPDFTFRITRRDWYLEHLGMLGNPQYDKDWKRKEQWYRQNDYHEQLLTTPVEGKSLADSLKDIFCARFGFSQEAIDRAITQETSN